MSIERGSRKNGKDSIVSEGNEMTLRIGLITDIHLGPDMDTMLGTYAAELLDRFIEVMGRDFRPDLIVDLGDRINDVEPGGDREKIAAVRQRLLSIGVPVLSTYGTHDLKNVKPEEQRRLLGKRQDYESIDCRGFHIVGLNSQDPSINGLGGTISDGQVEWLRKDLQISQGPVLVFCHHPLDEQDLEPHWYFRKHPEYAHAVNRGRVREVFRDSGRIRGVFNGHMHWNHMEVIDNVPYITVGSLVCCGLTGGAPGGCYAEVLVEEQGTVQVEVKGRLPAKFRYP